MQNLACAARRSATPAPWTSFHGFASNASSDTHATCASCSAMAYPANAVACAFVSASSFGGPTHTHASGDKIFSPHSGSGRGSISGHRNNIAAFASFAAAR